VERLSGATFVTMVKTADLRNRDHTACGRGCDRTWYGCVLLDRQVRAR
jgi:hypothetical protein